MQVNVDEQGVSPPLVKVINATPRGVDPALGLEEQHVIPFVRDIFVRLLVGTGEAYIRPPKGLLELGQRRLLCEILAPEIMVGAL